MQDHSEPRGATAARLGRMNVPAAGGVCAVTFRDGVIFETTPRAAPAVHDVCEMADPGVDDGFGGKKPDFATRPGLGAGSIEGRAIGLACAERGKNPMIVPDYADLGTAADACLNRAFLSTGQRWTASSRLIVTEGIHDAFVAEMNDRAVAPKVGDALDPETRIGPVVDQYQLDQNISYVQLAKDEGCAVAGGEIVDGPGFLQRPAMSVGATNRMRTSRDEIFGPCASIIKEADNDDAAAIANDTEFGLSVGPPHDLVETCQPFPPPCASRHGHGEFANGGCRLPLPLRGPQTFEPWSWGTG